MALRSGGGTEAAVAALLLGLCLAVFLPGLDAPFYSRRETREAVVVLEAVRGGDWVLPRRNGEELPTKPPLFHWLGALVSLATGEVHERTVRFPSALLGAVGVALTGLVAARRWGAGAGLCAGLVLATSLEWVRSATSARVDMTFAVFLSAALFALEGALGEEKPRPATLAVLYASLGLATLGKGPVALVIAALVAIVFLALRRDAGPARRWHWLPGGAAAIAIPAAWYAAAAVRGGQTFLDTIWKENVTRFVADDPSDIPHVHSAFYYVPQFLEGFLPWSPFLVPVALLLFRRRDRLHEERLLYPLVWAGVVFVFFSLSGGKRDVYLLPLYPAAALLVGRWWQLAARGEVATPRWMRRSLGTLGVAVAGALAAALALILAAAAGADPLARLAPLLGRGGLERYEVVHEALSERYPSLLLLDLAGLAAAASILAGLARRRLAFVFAGYAALPALAAIAFNGIYEPALAAKRTWKPFLEEVRRTLGDQDELVFYRTFDYAAVFHARRRIPAREDVFGPPPRERRLVLIGERRWERLPAGERRCLELVGRSRGTGYRGRERLVLAIVVSGCQPGGGASSAATSGSGRASGSQRSQSTST